MTQRQSLAPLTAFTFGYWGWGNATADLVAAVDLVEAARGFEAPLFADVRISRSVRAAGFRDDALAALVGAERYRWLPSLGNLRVKTRAGPAIQIAEPGAARELLDLTIESAARGRRVICFCACERPGLVELGTACHRVVVADLLREEARRRGIDLRTPEWPGGAPVRRDADVAPATLRGVQRGRAWIPIPAKEELSTWVALSWGSALCVRAPSLADTWIVSGPARRTSGAWQLPVLERVEAGGSAALAAGERWRAAAGILVS